MYVLELRKEMFPAVLSGKKTSTSRLGDRPIVPLQEVRFIAPDNSISVVVIVTNVTQCKFNELTSEEAIKEGYSSLEELKDTLSNIYHVKEDDNFTIIEFKVLSDLNSTNKINDGGKIC